MFCAASSRGDTQVEGALLCQTGSGHSPPGQIRACPELAMGTSLVRPRVRVAAAAFLASDLAFTFFGIAEFLGQSSPIVVHVSTACLGGSVFYV